MQCRNNLKQLALGCLNHEQIQGFLPSGGWYFGYYGDPDQGFTNRSPSGVPITIGSGTVETNYNGQPGGWLFNLMPYCEQQPLHNLGLSNNKAGRTLTTMTPLSVLNCPTRRPPILFTYFPNDSGSASGITNVDTSQFTAGIARSDYAGCSGSTSQPRISGTPPNVPPFQTSDWLNQSATAGPASAHGVIYMHSACKVADISDGLSNTFLCGEKIVTPDAYFTGTSGGDDQGWSMGWDYDNCRFTGHAYPTLTNHDVYNDVDGDGAYTPHQDTPGDYTYASMDCFGSAHANGFMMAFCDGSVQMMNYSISLEAYYRLGDRADGLTVDGKSF